MLWLNPTPNLLGWTELPGQLRGFLLIRAEGTQASGRTREPACTDRVGTLGDDWEKMTVDRPARTAWPAFPEADEEEDLQEVSLRS